MNFPQCILCNQYLEITKKGKEGRNALVNTQLLLTAIAVIYILIIFYLLDVITGHTITKSLAMGALDGKTIGKLFAVLAGGIIFLVLKRVLNRRWYASTVGEFNTLSDQEKEECSKRGIKIFITIFLPAMVILIVALLTTE